MTKKVTELSGAVLDYWVAKAAGMRAKMGDFSCLMFMGQWTVELDGEPVDTWAPFRPSTEWNQGGPIITSEQIGFRPAAPNKWYATDYQDRLPHYYGEGETPLIAAMRCFVASKFGDEVGDAN